MKSDPQPNKRGSRRVLALIVGIAIVAIVGIGTIWASRGPSTAPTAPTTPASVAGPTAVPTLDFFRGRSYPTPTAQP